MKITLNLNGATIEWDSSMGDDCVEVNRVAADIVCGLEAMDVLRMSVTRCDILDYGHDQTHDDILESIVPEIEEDEQMTIFSSEGKS